ncbi:hypothetical protein ASPFODRAFT_65920 [Aspergillus luchuensis CBS 106.47]|uniref:Uncharacterized protein n=1 Tax=Aspergillus luchuensis (strain CBS 106.47) TaxID=1137211 RepID=A0A1M3T0B5_ASPLC|nr:hypothetical protein ASPFODRAFT_65920 [Aspergillus luchuensis CBS 106.47]
MPPLLSRHFNSREELSYQLTNPSDIFSVLLILGSDVVWRAIAQLAGPPVTPIAFPFGWVAYVVSALLTAIGENRFMPAPDNPCEVINGRTGYVRENNSFILGRIMRDLEVWIDKRIKEHMRRMLEQPAQRGSGEAVRKPVRGGLCVSIYHAGIAAIPCELDGDWSILVVTAAGIILSFTAASLRQWPKEKWACRHNSTKTVILTKGNGSQHAIVIIEDNKGLDIEDLATGPSAMDVSIPFSVTKIALLILAFLRVALLVVAAGVKQHSWFLLAIGGIGPLEDIFVAGSPRHPAAFGMPLREFMNTLFAVEQAYPQGGRSMLDTFFPGKLRPNRDGMSLKGWRTPGSVSGRPG